MLKELNSNQNKSIETHRKMKNEPFLMEHKCAGQARDLNCNNPGQSKVYALLSM